MAAAAGAVDDDDESATASRTPRSASNKDSANESMLSWTAVTGSTFMDADTSGVVILEAWLGWIMIMA